MTETYETTPAVDGVLIEPAVPIFRIFSVEKAMEFYRDFLGFTVDWEHRFGPNMPLYCQVSRSGMQLHLSEHAGDASPGARVFVPMRGVKALHAELTARNYPYMRPGLEQAPGGWKSPSSIRSAIASPSANARSSRKADFAASDDAHQAMLIRQGSSD